MIHDSRDITITRSTFADELDLEGTSTARISDSQVFSFSADLQSRNVTIQGSKCTWIQVGPQASHVSVIQDQVPTSGGIVIDDADHTLVERSIIANAPAVAVVISGDSPYTAVTGNQISGSWIGLQVQDTSGTSDLPSTHVTIRGNTFKDNGAAGIFIDLTLQSHAQGDLVADNTFTSNGYHSRGWVDSTGQPVKDGIHIRIPDHSPVMTVQGNHTSGNARRGIYAVPGSVLDGGGNTSSGDGCIGVTCIKESSPRVAATATGSSLCGDACEARSTVPPVDRDWMHHKLQIFLTAVHAVNTHPEWAGPSSEADEALAAAYRHEPTAKKILRLLDPGLGDFDIGKDSGAGSSHTAEANARRGLGVLADMDAWYKHLARDAPMLPADQFHPWVWNASQTLWETGHYREAVHAAATAVNAHAQARLGRRDISDDKLMQEAFSSHEPRAPQSRLRCPGDPADQTVQSRQRGALSFAVGCYFAIRNPASHEHQEWSQQTALECLAAFSILARWISDWQLLPMP